MMKPCKLAILKRSVAKPDMMTQDCQPTFWGGVVDGKPNWVFLKSNAVLLNKRDAQRDLVENPQFVEANQISWCEVLHETHFELVELIEKKSFAFIIKRTTSNAADNPYFWKDVTVVQEVLAVVHDWHAKPYQASLLTASEKDRLISLLKERHPDWKFEAIDLFTE